MSESGESIHFGPTAANYEEFERLSDINNEIHDVFKEHYYLSEFVAIQGKPDDEFDLRVDMILGGLVPIRIAGGNQPADIILMRSANESSKDTVIVFEGEQIELGSHRISRLASPGKKLSDKTVEEIQSWVHSASWSREDSLRLAERWQKAHRIGPELDNQ